MKRVGTLALALCLLAASPLCGAEMKKVRWNLATT